MIFKENKIPYFINIRGELYNLSLPRVMGILNVTPDSFYSGYRFTEESRIKERVEQIIFQGGDIIDLGA